MRSSASGHHSTTGTQPRSSCAETTRVEPTAAGSTLDSVLLPLLLRLRLRRLRRLVCLRLLCLEHRGQILHRSIACAERLELVPVLERRNDRRRVVLDAVDDEVILEVRREDERGDSRSRAPDIVRSGYAALSGRRNVIPLAAELVVRDDDHGVLRARTLLDRLEQVDEMVTAVGLARVAGMLVLRPERLHEADLPELALVRRRGGEILELDLVAEVLLPVLRPLLRLGRERREVVEGLVVVLEEVVRAPRPEPP